MKPVKEGKVREIYDNGDSLIMVATDRISCFDVILHNTVTNKGKVLTQISKFWFDLTQDILPNHMITTDVKEMPEYFQSPEFDGKTMMGRKLKSFVTAPSLFTKSAQTMLTAMESSLPTPNLSLVSMRTAISLSVMRC